MFEGFSINTECMIVLSFQKLYEPQTVQVLMHIRCMTKIADQSKAAKRRLNCDGDGEQNN